MKQALFQGACYYYSSDLLKIYLCGTPSRLKYGVVRDAFSKLDEKAVLKQVPGNVGRINHSWNRLTMVMRAVSVIRQVSIKG